MVDDRQRVDLHHELLTEQMGDIALMPLYWEVVPILMLRGVTGHFGQNIETPFKDLPEEFKKILDTMVRASEEAQPKSQE